MITEQLKEFQQLLPQQIAGYKSWGEVTYKTIYFIDNGIYRKIESNKDILEWTENDISDLDPSEDWVKKINLNKKYKLLIITRQQYASQIKEEIPPVLDDQTQVVGVTVRVVDKEKILKGLKNRTACILTNGDSVILAENMEEGYIASKILEKCSQCKIRAEKIGGTVTFSRIEAWLMKKYYDYKYSKIKYKNKKKKVIQ